MGLKGQKIDDIKEVCSHPMALLQCKEFFKKHPHIKLIEDGEFHQVINDGEEDLYFVCVFDGKRTHK